MMAEKTNGVNEMFLRIINKTDVNIKNQQRWDVDLTNEQKIEILKDIFEQNPQVFLSRFGQWISVEDLKHFPANSGSDMEYALDVLRKSLKAKASGSCVKNRRYEALQRLQKDTSYFSVDEMRQRCPLLYEQYVGQYMTDKERFEQEEAKMKSEVKLSAFIFEQIDRDWLSQKQQEEQEMEESIEEEEDDDEESEECHRGIDGYSRDRKGHCDDMTSEAETSSALTNLSSEEKLRLKEEFLTIMKQRFLDGKDEEFDYSNVDRNDEYDNLDILSQDEEETYFDDEEEETLVTLDNEQTMSNDSEDDYLSDKILEKCCPLKT